jgi:hypothetical protein
MCNNQIAFEETRPIQFEVRLATVFIGSVNPFFYNLQTKFADWYLQFDIDPQFTTSYGYLTTIATHGRCTAVFNFIPGYLCRLRKIYLGEMVRAGKVLCGVLAFSLVD